ncbi:hypothetical protein [Synechococcus phage S-M1]|uniref:Uncharacterized protein n=1 Tax=Synechococcus phage QB2 TaxID=3159453 RepID=A0AAU8EKP8_9CAUD|nr:hypothetical protein [Synechococcus phage S-M1]
MSKLHKQLRERILELQMGYLFEEPCPIYEPDFDDSLWDCRLTYDYEEDEETQ